MSMIFSFPDVGEGIHEGRLIQWLVEEGQDVEVDQAVVKIETDKAVVELPSPEAGSILKRHAEAGQTIHVGDPLVTIGETGEDHKKPVEQDKQPSAPADQKETEHDDSTAKHETASSPSGPEEVRKRLKRAPATPHTRALARRLGVDIESVAGSGPGGRITDDDIEKKAAGEQTAAAQVKKTSLSIRSAQAGSDGEERIPITHLRSVIAKAMVESKQISAHVTHVDEADVTELFELYAQVKDKVSEQFGVRMTILPFFVKALVSALKEHPVLNASIDDDKDEIILKRYYNIGVAVDTPDGLIVPVVKNAHRKDIVTLAAELDDLANRARSRELDLDEIRGGTCTITNMGALGGILATPIIHQPELAIVGIHAMKDRPVVRNGEIVIRKIMYLSVSFDHRAIDGVEAARFMSHIVSLVSDPKLLMTRL